MFDIICVTDRRLCEGDFLNQIEKIAAGKPDALILREKDLRKDSYQNLAKTVIPICENAGVKCILHTHIHAAMALGCLDIHLPLPVLNDTYMYELAPFESVGVSCHSLDDANRAINQCATYITFGHVFETDCKKGLPPRGLEMLKSITDAAEIPVYAIGGINEDNISRVRQAGAAGACIMSSFMKAENPAKLIERLRKKALT